VTQAASRVGKRNEVFQRLESSVMHKQSVGRAERSADAGCKPLFVLLCNCDCLKADVQIRGLAPKLQNNLQVEFTSRHSLTISNHYREWRVCYRGEWQRRVRLGLPLIMASFILECLFELLI